MLPRTRDRSRKFDIVLFGATGFTGKLVAEYLVRHYLGTGDRGDGVRLALAGRSQSKLEEVRRELAGIRAEAASLPIVVADSFDAIRLDEVAAEASVVCTTVGPYAMLGEKLVAACVKNGTDYCDLTGEVHFIRRMVDRHHEEARTSGARIVHCCGFDSIPSDLGTLMMQEAMKARHGVPAREVKFFAAESKGSASGGTIASVLNMLDEAKHDKALRRMMADPYALSPEGERKGADGRDQMGVRYDEDLKSWTGPFVMAAINTRIVRRSHALLGYPWGRDFRYSEVMSFGRGAKGALVSAAVTGGLAGFMGAASFRPTRKLLEKKLPKSGEGPSREQREAGYFKVRLIAKGHGSERPITLRGRVEGHNDPGYGETAKMLGESALCLALDSAVPESGGGILTPATAMGMRLLERLREAGMTFEVD